MEPLWLESIAEDEDTRRILLRLAAISRSGRTSSFLREVRLDPELDDETKREVVTLAKDERFLRAVEEHLVQTRPSH